MNKTIWLATTALVAMSVAASPAFAGRSSAEKREAELSELKARIEKLEQEAAAAKAEADDERIANGARLSKVEQTQDAVQWSFADGRPSVRSGDGRFELAFRGRFMFDMASYEQDAADFGNGYASTVGTCNITNVLCDQGSGAVFRRVRFGVEGKFFRDFIYEMRFDFGGSGQEGDGTVNIMRVGYTGIPNTRIHLGAIQPIMTMYDATSSAELTTMERPAVITALVGAFGGDNARKGIEVTWQKENVFYNGSNLMLSAAYTGERAGSTNGSDHTGIPGNDESTHLLGRAAMRLWSDGVSNVQVGATAAQVLNADARTLRLESRPELRVSGDRYIDTGNLTVQDGDNTAYGFEFGANFQNLYVAAEWYKMSLDRPGATVDPEFSGWYVEGEWIITGENKRYAASATNNNVAVFRGPSVASPWSMGGGTGAWSLHGRHSVLDLNAFELDAVAANRVRGGEQTITNVGVTWYINSNLKMMGEYSMVDIERLNAAGASLDTEFDIIQGRAMFTF
jgi:phosphate-selective porin OprO/OprP